MFLSLIFFLIYASAFVFAKSALCCASFLFVEFLPVQLANHLTQMVSDSPSWRDANVLSNCERYDSTAHALVLIPVLILRLASGLFMSQRVISWRRSLSCHENSSPDSFRSFMSDAARVLRSSRIVLF